LRASATDGVEVGLADRVGVGAEVGVQVGVGEALDRADWPTPRGSKPTMSNRQTTSCGRPWAR
jgi:hypothetical protein